VIACVRGLWTQLLSPHGGLVWGSVSTRLFLQRFDKLPFFRNRIFVQAALLPSYSSNASSKAPSLHGRYPLPRYYEPLRLPARAAPRLCRACPVGVRLPSPPCRVSQVPRLIFPCALSPPTPEGPASACSLLPRRFQASSSLADWPPSLSVTSPYLVRLRYASQDCSPVFHHTHYSAPPRLIYTFERSTHLVN